MTYHESTNSITWISTNDLLTLSGVLIVGNTYTLTETKAPAGYALANSITFTVNIDGTVHIEGKENSDMVTVHDTAITIDLEKQDILGHVINESQLGYAEFSLEGQLSDESQKVEGITSQNIHDKLSGKLIVGNTYILTETKAPNGYELTDPITFTINNDGSVSIGDDNVGEKIIVRDIPIQVKIKKTDLNNDPLSDAIFKLTDKTLNRIVAEEIKVIDDEGEVFIPNGLLIQGHEYILEETKAPDGYELADSITFNVNTDGTVHIDGKENSDMIIVQDASIQITLIKQDLLKKQLSGGVFELKENDTVLQTLTTSDEGIVINGLIQGKEYELREIKAPDGYILKDISVTFTVENDGTVTFNETEDIKGSGTSSITVNNTKTYLELSKIDNETGNKLSKAVLQIYKASDFINGKPVGEAVASWSSDDNIGHIEGLVSETDYVLYEKQAVSGYDSFKPVYFRLNKDNTITISERDDLIFDSSTNTITMKDTRIRGHIQINKIAKGNVENVKFDLYRKDGTKIAENLTTDSKGQWTSKDNQTEKFIDIDQQKVPFSKGLTTGEYYLLETQATSDTVLNANKYTFTIGDSDSKAHGTVINVNIENQAFTSDVKVIKLDETSGKGISGVNFVLSYKEEYQNDIKTITGVTNQNGELLFKNLPKGEYTIKEEATIGYDKSTLFEGKFIIGESDNGKTIEIKEGSKIEKTKGSWNQDGILNTRVLGSVTLYKMDESQGLNDVEFVLMKKNDEGFFDKIMNVITGNEYEYTNSITGKKLEKEGQLTINDLAWGTYKLVEVKAKDGYSTTDVDTILETVEFTIDRKSEKEIKLNTDGNKFYNHKTSLIIRKIGKDDEVLDKAEFELTGKMADIKETSRTVKVKDGTLKLEGILIGGETYTLKETKAPEGYEVNGEVLRFKMEENGKIEILEGAKGYELITSTFFDNQIEVTDEKISIIIEKIDNETQEKLIGARFELTPEKGSYFTGHEEKIVLEGENLISGLTGKVIAGHSYILKEIKAPDGYVLLDEEIIIKINSDGSIEAINDYINVDQDTIQVKNLPIEVSFIKRMTNNDNQNIAGAQLSISGRFADRKENTITWTTTKQPQVFKNVFIAGEKYILKELNAPTGAMFDENNQIVFTVDEYGQIIYDTNEISYQDGKVIVWNEPTVVSINKLDSGNNRNLAGARLQILDQNKNIVEEWVSTNKAHVITGKLDANKQYTLHEVSAPTGYLTAADVSFKVNPTGLIEVTMIDPRIPEATTLPNLIIYKVNQDEQFLIGASFRLVKVENDQEIEIGVRSGGPRFEFVGLKDGIYRIYEVNVPSGYVGLDDYFEIEIVNKNIYFDGLLEHSFTVYNTNDGSDPYVLGDEIDEDDYQEWVLGEETKSKTKTSDDQDIFGYSSLSIITIILLYLLKKKKFNQG